MFRSIIKNFLGILFLSLLLTTNSFAAKIVKLTNDVSSGSKFYKSLTGKVLQNNMDTK